MDAGGGCQEPDEEIKPRDDELVNFQGADEAGAVGTREVLLVDLSPVRNIKPAMPIFHPK